MKYAGLLLEHPMPENLTNRSGGIDNSKQAAMIWLEIELCPHPWQSVVGRPL
jgi:hypothetical protein